MPSKSVYVLFVDGFADWEPAHALAELRRHGGYRVETVGLSPATVESMGGMRVVPSTTLDAVNPDDVAVFILPGGDRWAQQPIEPALEAKLRELDDRQVPIAAICGATLVVAQLGLIKGRQHTSNGLAYLQSHVPGYSEAGRYVDAPAVRDRGLITASGLADVEFARELFEELGVLTAAERAEWAEIFRSARMPAA
ncbi:MAG TPA: type 1 glutamine amidotransferase family protein [Vicinamibacterales bacterium]|nr:type 1 glutamine amidotransferase family protein [Vicinamibacterales bacterium]